MKVAVALAAAVALTSVLSTAGVTEESTARPPDPAFSPGYIYAPTTMSPEMEEMERDLMRRFEGITIIDPNSHDDFQICDDLGGKVEQRGKETVCNIPPTK